jgi:hypothetical protein
MVNFWKRYKDYEATKLLNAVQMLKSNVPKDYFYLRGATQRAFITSMSTSNSEVLSWKAISVLFQTVASSYTDVQL